MKSTIGQLFAVKTSLSFAAQFWSFAAFTVFFAPWLVSRGVGAGEIAFILAMAQVMRSLFGPIGALFADGFEHKKTPVLIMNLLTVICLFCLYFVDDYLLIFLVVILYSIASAAVVPVLEGLTIKGAEKYNFEFGRIRLWGSVSFIISSYACGRVIDAYGYDIFISWMLFGAIASCIAGVFLPTLGAAPAAAQAPTEKVKKFDLAGALLLVKQPIFMIILIAVSFIQASHAVFYGFGAIHWEAIGYSNELIGQLWATSVIGEVVLFIFSGKLATVFGPRRMLILAAFVAIIRWMILSLDPPLYVVFIAQLMHAFTFGAVYLGALNLISRSVPDNLISTAMAINVSINMGIFMSIALVISGYLYESYANLAYWFGAFLALIGLLISLGLKFIWNGDALEFGKPKNK